MAISGAGGWIPSVGVTIRNGELITVGFAQNKPPDHVCTDMEFAAQWIRHKLQANEEPTIQIDIRRQNYPKLQQRLMEMGLLRRESSRNLTFRFRRLEITLAIRLTTMGKCRA